MTDTYRTEQEAFWAGSFGNAYIDRNRDAAILASRTAMFTRILSRAGKVGSVVEFGANIGLNMLALRTLLPEAKLSAIEINPEAVKILETQERLNVHHGSILEPQVDAPHDLSFTSGVLIHINPDALPSVYDNLYAASATSRCRNITTRPPSRSPIGGMTTGCSNGISPATCWTGSRTSNWSITGFAITGTRISRRTT